MIDNASSCQNQFDSFEKYEIKDSFPYHEIMTSVPYADNCYYTLNATLNLPIFDIVW